MTAMMFLKVQGVTGESEDSMHADWSDIKSFAWGASQPGGVGAISNAGRASFNDLQVNAYMDKATPALIQNCASGQRLSNVQVEVCKSTGQKKVFCKITLEDVLVTSAQVVGIDHNDSLERMVMSYGFQAARVKKSYIDKHGNGAESSVAWNIAKNVAM